MKYKTTSRAVKSGYAKIIGAGYCSLYNLLKYSNPIAYNSGICGWNYDIYEVEGVAICTGYNPLNNKNVNCDYAMMKKYDDKAKGKNQHQVEKLLKEFVNKSCGWEV